MQIRCSWIEPQANIKREPILNLPVAFGRDLATMQQRKPGIFPRMVISHNAISSYHCLIELENNQLVVIDQNSTNGIFVNNIKQQKAGLNDGDILKIGGVEITINIMITYSPHPPTPSPTGEGENSYIPKPVRINFYNANGQQQNRILPPPIALGKDAMTLLEEKTQPNRNIASVQEIKDNSLNDYHALFSIENHQLVVMDQNTKHGIFVNGTKQQKAILQHGDNLRLGNVKGTIIMTQNEMIIDIHNTQNSHKIQPQIPQTNPQIQPQIPQTNPQIQPQIQQTQPQIQPQIPQTNPQVQPQIPQTNPQIPQRQSKQQITIKLYNANGQKISDTLNLPIALGRELNSMISKIGNDITPVAINDDSISPYHALIDVTHGHLRITDQDSDNGIFVNDQKFQISLLKNRDKLKLGNLNGTIIITQNEMIIDIDNIETPIIGTGIECTKCGTVYTNGDRNAMCMKKCGNSLANAKTVFGLPKIIEVKVN